MTWIWGPCLVAGLTAVVAVAQPANRQSDWNSLQSLQPGARLSLIARDGKFIRGRFVAWSPEGIEISSNRGLSKLRTGDIRRIAVQQKASRWRGAGVAALIGFGVSFPFGAGFAGHIMDRNDPGFKARVGMGSGFGLFGAGVAAPIGALLGGKNDTTVYRAPRDSSRTTP